MIFALAALTALTALAPTQDLGSWPQHSMDRPQPPVVTPAPSDKPYAPPSDAVVLFDGSTLAGWEVDSGKPAAWKLENGYMEVVRGTGSIHTTRRFGDCQLHVEWAAPTPPEGEGQERGNSGVYLMSLYEVQVLDSYQNKTYPEGQCAAVYNQRPPMVNASRKPGEWQTYDIAFTAPRFGPDGKVQRPGFVTVFHNGVLVQNNFELKGETLYIGKPVYRKYDAAPIKLQAHGDPSPPISFRNIWVRELP